MKVIDFSQTNSILNQYISEIRNVEVQNDRLRVSAVTLNGSEKSWRMK